MAEEKVDVALLNNANEYVEVYKISRALKMIMDEPARYGVTGTDLKVEQFIEIIMNNYDNKALHLHSVYRSKPSEDTLRKALAAARNLTLKKPGKSMEAVQEISDHPEILTNSYATFKQDQDERLDSSVENVADLKAELKEQKKANAKQKRKLGWGIFGKIATAVVGAAVGASYLTSVFTLAGGFVGMASISTMPFMLLGAAGGALLYWAGKKALGTIWKALSESNDAARQVLKGDENVKGSNKALKKAKQLEKQNVKALNRMRANMNACAPENAEAYVDFEKFVNNTLVRPEIEDAIKINNAIIKEDGQSLTDEKGNDAILIKGNGEKGKTGPGTGVNANNQRGDEEKGVDVDERGLGGVVIPEHKKPEEDKFTRIAKNVKNATEEELNQGRKYLEQLEKEEQIKKDAERARLNAEEERRHKEDLNKKQAAYSGLLWENVYNDQIEMETNFVNSVGTRAGQVDSNDKNFSLDPIEVDIYQALLKKAAEECIDSNVSVSAANKAAVAEQVVNYYLSTNEAGDIPELPDGVTAEEVKKSMDGVVKRQQEAVAARENAQKDMQQFRQVKFDGNKRSVDDMIVAAIDEIAATDEGKKLLIASGAAKTSINLTERAASEYDSLLTRNFSLIGKLNEYFTGKTRDMLGTKPEMLIYDNSFGGYDLTELEEQIVATAKKQVEREMADREAAAAAKEAEAAAKKQAKIDKKFERISENVANASDRDIERGLEYLEREEAKEAKRIERSDARAERFAEKEQEKHRKEETKVYKGLFDEAIALEEERVRAETEAAHKNLLIEDLEKLESLDLSKLGEQQAKRIRAAKSKLELSPESHRIYNEHRQAIVDENKKKDPNGRAKISDADIMVDALGRTINSLSEMTQEDESKVRKMTRADIERESDRSFLKELWDMITGKNKKKQAGSEISEEMERE